MNIETSKDKQITTSECTNFLEFRAYGLMRCGNHAIIEWIQSQYAGQVTCFLNNVKHGDYDPYKSYEQRVVTGIDAQVEVEDLRAMKKRLLIYSYEDRYELETSEMTFYKSVFQPEFEKKRKTYLGDSKYQFDILIIRDPFNFLASRMKLMQVRGPQGGVTDLSLIVKNWKILAREAIQLTQNPQPGKVVVIFRDWVSDLSYRKGLSKLLMGTYTDTSMENTPEYGGGSSFRDSDKLTLRMIADRWRKLFNLERYKRLGHYWRRVTAPDKKKSVLERWKQLADDKVYCDLISDYELLELSDELFGETPGVREFVKSIKSNRFST